MALRTKSSNMLAAADGASIYFEERGQGPAVVLIHGAASSARSFDALIPILSAQFRTIALDLRGLGRSSRVENMEPTAWTSDLVGLLDHLELDQAHLIGRSLGARVAGRVALDHRDRVASLTVDAPILGVAESADAALNDRFSKPRDAAQESRWRWVHGDDWRDAVAFYARARRDAALQQHLTLRPRLAELTLPTLIARGDLDDVVHPLDHAIEWHRAHPQSKLWIAPNTGFSVSLARPAEFAEAFSRFLFGAFISG